MTPGEKVKDAEKGAKIGEIEEIDMKPMTHGEPDPKKSAVE